MKTYPLIGVIGVHYINGVPRSMQAGKGVFAEEFIQSALVNHGVTYEERAFADSIYEDIAVWLGVTVEYMKANKAIFRRILQGYGTDFARHVRGENCWVDRFDAFVEDAQTPLLEPVSFVIPDVRMPNEAKYIKERGGVVVRVVRHSPTFSGDVALLEHVTELNILELPFDVEILNDSTLEEFKRESGKMADHLLLAYESGKLSQYIAHRQAVSGHQQSNCQNHEVPRQADCALA